MRGNKLNERHEVPNPYKLDIIKISMDQSKDDKRKWQPGAPVTFEVSHQAVTRINTSKEEDARASLGEEYKETSGHESDGTLV